MEREEIVAYVQKMEILGDGRREHAELATARGRERRARSAQVREAPQQLRVDPLAIESACEHGAGAAHHGHAWTGRS